MEAFEGGENGYRIEIPADSSIGVADMQVRHELLATLQALIDNELTEKQRLAIRAFLSGFSTDGIAERVGSNRNSVYKLIMMPVSSSSKVWKMQAFLLPTF